LSQVWTLRIDRRQADRAAIIADLTSLAQAAGVSLSVVPESEFIAAPDGGAFRDFIVAATLSAPHSEQLEYVAEHLLDAHRWNVDFMRTQEDVVVILTMTEADLDDVLALQHVAYSDLVEQPEVMIDKFHHGKTLCQIARSTSGQAVGYLLAHAWSTAMIPPPWNALLPALDAADMLYLHDLALAPQARGHNLGTRMTAACLDAARALGLTHAGLIAVQGAQPFWERQGFLVVDPSPALAQKLATYGKDAVYMTRAL
jgi:ribosomal protein S18 acetylase RimI-like enzyme